MAKIVTSPYSSMAASAKRVITAHEAVEAGIATHAEKHLIEVDLKRLRAETQEKIADGIERYNS